MKVERVVNGEPKTYDAMAPCKDCEGVGNFPKPSIADPALVKPARGDTGKGRDWKADAQEWIDKNPEVCEVFLRLARSKASRGKKFGIGALTEVVRWECDDFDGGNGLKINNNFRAYIARWLIARDPALEKYIDFRETRFK